MDLEGSGSDRNDVTFQWEYLGFCTVQTAVGLAIDTSTLL
jgi:hypothetical protein